METFLALAGWAEATRKPLAGDMSSRRYLRLFRGEETAVLMDSPPGTGDDPADFLRIARHLTGLGLSPPAILAEDAARGFLLLEDLGDGLFARLIADDPDCATDLTCEAVKVLAHLQAHPAPQGLPDLSPADWAEAAALALTVYAPAMGGALTDTGPFRTCLAAALAAHADGPRVLILRDYHAENLLWLPGRAGLARVGLLDFQLGQMGQPLYDVASLLQDARRDVAPAVEAAGLAAFAVASGRAHDPAAYAVLGAQRALRILGVVARIATAGGRPDYLRLLPRVWAQLQRNLAHPALEALAGICAAVLPPPAPSTLEEIARRCPTPKP